MDQVVEAGQMVLWLPYEGRITLSPDLSAGPCNVQGRRGSRGALSWCCSRGIARSDLRGRSFGRSLVLRKHSDPWLKDVEAHMDVYMVL